MIGKQKRMKQTEVEHWAEQARLDLPDQWTEIQGRLEHPQPAAQPERSGAKADRPRRRRYVLAANLALLAIVVGLVVAITLPGGWPVRTDPSSLAPTPIGTSVTTGTTATTVTTPTTTPTTPTPVPYHQVIYPIESQQGNLVFYQPSVPLSSLEGATLRSTHIDLSLEGKYLPYILGLDNDWNLLIRTGVESGVGMYEVDPEVPTYEYGFYNLRDESYRRLFRVDARSPWNPEITAHYTTFIPPNWDGEQVLFSACVTTQTISTHPNIGIHTVATGETVIYSLDETLHESLAGGPHAIQNAFVVNGSIYFYVHLYDDNKSNSKDGVVYRIDIAAGTCHPVLSTGLELGQLANLNGRIAWIEPGSVRYIDSPDTAISIDYPEMNWPLSFWSLDLYAVVTKGGPWIDPHGLRHMPGGEDVAFQKTAWLYNQGERLPLIGVKKDGGGLSSFPAGDHLFFAGSYESSCVVFSLQSERLVTLDGIPERILETSHNFWTAD
ncbi:MAG: hypothetical protein GX153_11340, partial [Clostridiaceae bacterium]|nr:hypothetical protein [Clostridiaceae bacterium]